LTSMEPRRLLVAVPIEPLRFTFPFAFWNVSVLEAFAKLSILAERVILPRPVTPVERMADCTRVMGAWKEIASPVVTIEKADNAEPNSTFALPELLVWVIVPSKLKAP